MRCSYLLRVEGIKAYVSTGINQVCVEQSYYFVQRSGLDRIDETPHFIDVRYISLALIRESEVGER
ncbi:MAG: hypothetical protein OES38_16820, partial [Gammaproteobacteria bacterium]|nr:hypothetical protein [Gammaproteobacteria bacterium]